MARGGAGRAVARVWLSSEGPRPPPGPRSHTFRASGGAHKRPLPPRPALTPPWRLRTDVVPGYAAAPGATLGATPATPCPEESYRAGAAPYDAVAGITCTPCPAETKADAPGADSESACLAPPGFGWDAASGAAKPCPVGSFSAAAGRGPCTPCGEGLLTEAAGSKGADDCFTPPGFFTVRAADGSFTAAPCPAGSYGADGKTYGLVEVACSECEPGTTTAAAGSSRPNDCVTLPGYGWEPGAVASLCPFGTYAPGGSQARCTPCRAHYNTTRGGVAGGEAVAGATSASECVLAAGWAADGAGGIKPCPAGTYKSLLGPSACVACPRGTTGSDPGGGATGPDGCDACRPGFGAAAIDAAAPACGVCPSGTYSEGGVRGGRACAPCPKAPGYTGRMVTKPVSAQEGGREGGAPPCSTTLFPFALRVVHGSPTTHPRALVRPLPGTPACMR
jgi:hypothetical protein